MPVGKSALKLAPYNNGKIVYWNVQLSGDCVGHVYLTSGGNYVYQVFNREKNKSLGRCNTEEEALELVYKYLKKLDEKQTRD